MTIKRFKAFTLIEMLTVIVIIAILVALLFPAIQSAIRKAEMASAKADITSIVTGVRSFYNEYGTVPAAAGPDSGVGGAGGNNSTVIYALLGSGYGTSTLNPRGIAFMQIPSRKGAYNISSGILYDPWGTPYYILLDTAYAGAFPSSGLSGVATNYIGQAGPVVVSSFGPDQIGGTSDDIVNYQ